MGEMEFTRSVILEVPVSSAAEGTKLRDLIAEHLEAAPFPIPKGARIHVVAGAPRPSPRKR